MLKTFTLDELAQYDGTGENPVYVAYKGKVYDVSDGTNWEDGSHYQHMAGEDLTDQMQDAPHSDDVIAKFPIVGELAP